MFRGSVKSTGYPLHSPISPSLPIPCVTVCHHISTGLYAVILSEVVGVDDTLTTNTLKTPAGYRPTQSFAHYRYASLKDGDTF
jgi:hypothetical protein